MNLNRPEGTGPARDVREVWDFMCRNKEKLKKTKVEVCGRRVKKDGVYEKNVLRTERPRPLLRRTQRPGRHPGDGARPLLRIDSSVSPPRPDLQRRMVEYKGGVPLQWAKWFCTEKVNRAKDVKPLNFMIRSATSRWWTGSGR